MTRDRFGVWWTTEDWRGMCLPRRVSVTTVTFPGHEDAR